MKTDNIYLEDAYLAMIDAKIIGHTAAGGILIDRNIFYPKGGGQPGDHGTLRVSGSEISIIDTVYGVDGAINLIPETAAGLPPVGEKVECALAWKRRFGHMRIHTALHLLSAVLPYPVTGGQIGERDGRLDFDIADATLASKEEVGAALNDLIERGDRVTTEWISDEELAARPELVKTMAVKPPMGRGRVRLVRIGADTDLQPCGGTHVGNTSEIGPVIIKKIEKKGRMNRRVRISLAD